MKVLLYINEKGGVGKTTLAITTACGLAARGNRVVLIDTDEQGHVARGLGFEKEPMLFELLQRNRPWSEVLRQVPAEKFLPPGSSTRQGGQLLILPSNVETRALPYTMRPDGLQLRKRIEQLASAIDYVVIDTGPSASLIHLVIYSAADYVIYPTKTEELSFDGLVEALGHLDSANAVRGSNHLPPIAVLGIVPTMFRTRVLEHETNLKSLREVYGDQVWEPIAERAVWAEALAGASGYVPVYAHAPNTPAALEANLLIQRIETAMKGEPNEQPAQAG